MNAFSVSNTIRFEKNVSRFLNIKNFTFEPVGNDDADFPFTNLSKKELHQLLIDAYNLGREQQARKDRAK